MNVIRNIKIIMLGIVCAALINPVFCMINMNKHQETDSSHALPGTAAIFPGVTSPSTSAPTAPTPARVEDGKTEIKILAGATIDEKAGIISDFDPLGINTRLLSIFIDGGFFQIEKNHAAYAASGKYKTLYESPGMIPRELNLVFIKDGTKAVIGSRTYHIMPSKKRVSMGSIRIHEAYRRLGLATLLMLAALHDSDITRYSCNRAIAIPLTPESEQLFKKFGFTQNKKRKRVEAQDLRSMLREKTARLIDEVFIAKLKQTE